MEVVVEKEGDEKHETSDLKLEWYVFIVISGIVTNWIST